MDATSDDRRQRDLFNGVQLAEQIMENIESMQFRLDTARMFLAVSFLTLPFPLVLFLSGSNAPALPLIGCYLLVGAIFTTTATHVRHYKRRLRWDKRALREMTSVLAEHLPPKADLPALSVIRQALLRIRLERIFPALASQVFASRKS